MLKILTTTLILGGVFFSVMNVQQDGPVHRDGDEQQHLSWNDWY